MSDNPKEAFGATKPPVALIPPAGKLHCAMALELGAAKYGAYNWRETRVSAMTYINAAMRHLDAYLDGDDYDVDAPDNLVHNLGAVMACCAILLDAAENTVLVDDRPQPGRASSVQMELKRAKCQHAEKKP